MYFDFNLEKEIKITVIDSGKNYTDCQTDEDFLWLLVYLLLKEIEKK